MLFLKKCLQLNQMVCETDVELVLHNLHAQLDVLKPLQGISL